MDLQTRRGLILLGLFLQYFQGSAQTSTLTGVSDACYSSMTSYVGSLDISTILADPTSFLSDTTGFETLCSQTELASLYDSQLFIDAQCPENSVDDIYLLVTSVLQYGCLNPDGEYCAVSIQTALTDSGLLDQLTAVGGDFASIDSSAFDLPTLCSALQGSGAGIVLLLKIGYYVEGVPAWDASLT
eukprot:gene1913-2595_t